MSPAIKMATYRNDSGGLGEVTIGNAPGDAPTVYKAEAGATVEGPAAYREAFARSGFVLDDTPKPEGGAVNDAKIKPPAAKEEPPKRSATIPTGTVITAEGRTPIEKLVEKSGSDEEKHEAPGHRRKAPG